jgi:hypothetical protein
MKQTVDVIVFYRATPVDVVINGQSITVIRPVPQQGGSTQWQH